jgi:hypothetical protein
VRTLERNKTSFYYALYLGKEENIDADGNATGTYTILYSNPVECRGNISASSGSVQVEQFGNDLQYDKVVVLDDVNVPIDENSVLWVDKEVEHDKYGNPVFDYIVKKVARSLNSVSFAISKVKLS